MATVVSDEVWAQLPQQRLPRRRVLGVVGAVLLLLLATAAADQAGLLRPRLTADATGSAVGRGERVFTEQVTLHNDGSTDLTVEELGVAVPWLRVVKASSLLGNLSEGGGHPLPLALPAGQDLALVLELRVRDCRALQRTDVGLEATVRGPLRTSRVHLALRGTQDPAAPGSYTYSGSTDPWEVPWPLEDAANACAVPLPPR
ncbi:MAG TPA: hypothetical protein VFS29_05945 [Motilibacteraceae bacterium]|nr:hypothetical protein [Motilibacteraceae bacterium]